MVSVSREKQRVRALPGFPRPACQVQIRWRRLAIVPSTLRSQFHGRLVGLVWGGRFVGTRTSWFTESSGF